MIPATQPDPRLCAAYCIGAQPLDVETLNERRRWRPASGHPGGWRVVRDWPNYPDLSPSMQELEGATGRRILFPSCEGAKRRANALNALE